jgi:anti-sigma factor RsiW
MRGRISDQDLTDYALNELQPEERLYVESMLAVSEECRNDVYEMIEMGQLLEEGFEREEGRVPAMLTREQRSRLLAAPHGTTPFQKAGSCARSRRVHGLCDHAARLLECRRAPWDDGERLYASLADGDQGRRA